MAFPPTNGPSQSTSLFDASSLSTRRVHGRGAFRPGIANHGPQHDRMVRNESKETPHYKPRSSRLVCRFRAQNMLLAYKTADHLRSWPRSPSGRPSRVHSRRIWRSDARGSGSELEARFSFLWSLGAMREDPPTVIIIEGPSLVSFPRLGSSGRDCFSLMLSALSQKSYGVLQAGGD